MRRFLTSLLVLLAMIDASRASGENTPDGGWISTRLRDHPLVGRAWASHRGILPADYRVVGFGDPRYLLLGEVHDNPDHHRLRATWLDFRCNRTLSGERHGIVFEQIRIDQEDALRSAVLSKLPARRLLDALEWSKSGWPSAEIYEPLFVQAIECNMTLLSGDPPSGRVRDVARNGLATLPEGIQVSLGLDKPLVGALSHALAEEIAASHCGMLPNDAIQRMTGAQRYRDAHLADAMIRASRELDWMTLIAGNGHVRRDRGVPHYLRLRGRPSESITTVMLIEVEEGKTDPEHYVPRDPDGKPAVDWIIFTPRADRPDPCEEMRKAMGGG